MTWFPWVLRGSEENVSELYTIHPWCVMITSQTPGSCPLCLTVDWGVVKDVGVWGEGRGGVRFVGEESQAFAWWAPWLQHAGRGWSSSDEERRTVLLNSTIIISKYFDDFIFPLYSTLQYILHNVALHCWLLPRNLPSSWLNNFTIFRGRTVLANEGRCMFNPNIITSWLTNDH